jgi:predicted RNase H-like nuclease (RuvC/YqgF family)
MMSVIYEEDKAAGKMLEELKLLTKLEKELENKMIQSKDEEEQLTAELDKFKTKLADTIEKKNKVDEKVWHI